ncbi:rRNA maturation RNase YbeY [Pseudooceanicola aestuarii]|uniref:rRNA maturation RNase YbeY n=1 Tax=Pseudooceanicola aestuarii TaxID=2697319 RepID=UPI0013D4D565|nr:rRNA maturation RNase YbeY [Pseudooceanicola aestuarii]
MTRLTDVLIEAPDWQVHDLPALAERAARATLTHLGLDPADWEISVLGCDDDRIATLNAEFRDKPAPTNVLSWPAEDLAPGIPGTRPAPPEPDDMFGDPALGDIAIALETCTREATAGGIPLDHHVLHLLVHGTLHLLGYDHVADADATIMEQTEVEILCKLGIPDPYTPNAGR